MTNKLEISRELAERIAKLLLNPEPSCWEVGPVSKALRALLANHSEEPLGVVAAPVVERQPVAWRIFDGEGCYDYTEDAEYVESWKAANGDKYASWVTPLFDSPPAPVAVPEGWKLVPITPTPEMVEALKARLMVASRGGILSAGVSLADAIAAAPACLDKVKEMNR